MQVVFTVVTKIIRLIVNHLKIYMISQNFITKKKTFQKISYKQDASRMGDNHTQKPLVNQTKLLIEVCV